MHRPYGREDSIPRKKVEIFLFFPKITLYIWGYLWYHQKAGHVPDDITMPVAQLWEKAVFVKQYTTRPYLAIGKYF